MTCIIKPTKLYESLLHIYLLICLCRYYHPCSSTLVNCRFNEFVLCVLIKDIGKNIEQRYQIHVLPVYARYTACVPVILAGRLRVDGGLKKWKDILLFNLFYKFIMIRCQYLYVLISEVFICFFSLAT